MMALASGAQLNPDNADSQQSIVKKSVTLMQVWHLKMFLLVGALSVKKGTRFSIKEDGQRKKGGELKERNYSTVLYLAFD